MASTASNGYDITQSQWEDLDFNLTTDNGNASSLATASFWTLYYRHPIYRTALYLSKNYLYVLTAIGVPCNMLSFLVLRRIKPVTSTIFVMMMLAVMDSLLLCMECTIMVLRVTGVSCTNVGCSFMMTVRMLLQYYPIWLVVLLTLERVIAVCFPLKASALCTPSNARRSLILMFILDCILCIVYTFIYEEQQYNGKSACSIKSKYIKFYTSIWVFVDEMFFVMIPLTLLFLGNIAIIIKLQTLREIYSSSNDMSTQERKRQNSSVTIMLLTVCITTFACLVPNAVYYLGLASFKILPSDDIRTAALKYLAKWMISIFTYSNNAVNFFLYILSGRRFRDVLREMMAEWLSQLNRMVR